MSQILFPNLMFEDELRHRPRCATANARRIVSELGPVMGLLSGNDTAETSILLVAPDAMPQELPPALEHIQFESLKSLSSNTLGDTRFVPWGWSRQAILTGRQLNLRFEAPDPEVVTAINSRQFLADFDQCFPLRGRATPEPFGILCSSLNDVCRSLKSFADRNVVNWVLKANLSQAAGNRLIGNGLIPVESQIAWLYRRFQAGEVVYAEPWVERMAECGLQFTVRRMESGDHETAFDGAAEMLTDAVGRYRGSILRRMAEKVWWEPAISHCRIIAERASEMGFFGVMGMDCMMYRHPTDGCAWLRVCHDINGRCTMGRVALSLMRFLQKGENGIWCHAPAKSSTVPWNPFDAVDRENVRIVKTSPTRIGSQPIKLQTALLISEDCRCLTRVVHKILGPDIRGSFSSH